MARNQKKSKGRWLAINVAALAGVKVSGDPGAIGVLPFVVTVDEDADGVASVDTEGVYEFTVNGVDQAGNATVSVGDRVFYTDADAIKLSRKNTGIPFGAIVPPDNDPAATEILAAAADGLCSVKIGA